MADPIHQFVIQPIFEFKPAGFDLSFTNSALWMVFAVIASSAFFMISSRKKAMVPDRLQSAGEIMYEFVANMVRENLGTRGKQYFPFIFSLFMFVLMGNLLGLLPTSFTFTSHLVVNAVLAFIVFFMVLIFGFINHGTHFFDLFAPPGVPLVLKFLLVPIEILSFIIRPITLSVRLFANMMAGHLVVKVFAGFSTMLAAAGVGGILMAFVPAVVNSAIFALELLVGVLQAYVFAILSCIYLKDSVDIAH